MKNLSSPEESRKRQLAINPTNFNNKAFIERNCVKFLIVRNTLQDKLASNFMFIKFFFCSVRLLSTFLDEQVHNKDSNYWIFITMSPLCATPSDVRAYPKVSTKTLVYPPSQEASCRQFNFCWLFMPHMYYTFFIIQTFYIFRPQREWTREHDSFLIREIPAVDPFQYKQSTVKKGQPWTQIADILNSIGSPQFLVSQRSVCERFTKLEKSFTKKWQMKRKHLALICQTLLNMSRRWKKLLQGKRMPGRNYCKKKGCHCHLWKWTTVTKGGASKCRRN